MQTGLLLFNRRGVQTIYIFKFLKVELVLKGLMTSLWIQIGLIGEMLIFIVFLWSFCANTIELT